MTLVHHNFKMNTFHSHLQNALKTTTANIPLRHSHRQNSEDVMIPGYVLKRCIVRVKKGEYKDGHDCRLYFVSVVPRRAVKATCILLK